MEKQWRGHFLKNSSVICEDEKMITATSRNTIKEANKNRLFHRPVIKEKEMSSNSTPFLIFTHWLPHVEIVSLHHHPPWTTWEINSFEDSSLPRIKEKSWTCSQSSADVTREASPGCPPARSYHTCLSLSCALMKARLRCTKCGGVYFLGAASTCQRVGNGGPAK